MTDGIDFLGYIVRPTHTIVRRRVVDHAVEKLTEWQRHHVHRRHLRATPEQYRQIQSVWSSYEGHFSHARTWRLQQQLHRRFPWLNAAIASRSFDHRLEGRTISIRCRS